MSARTWTVEHDWMTGAGFRAVVGMGDMGFRCGYVGVPEGHPLHGASYSEPAECLSFPEHEEIGKRGILSVFCARGQASPNVVFDVHGSLTFSAGHAEYPAASDGLWWFGFDCGHFDDGRSPEFIESSGYGHLYAGRGIARSAEYCVTECESLAWQLRSRVVPHVGAKFVLFWIAIGFAIGSILGWMP